uniref:hypothetical protein n=1 Tax=Alistipes sp. TaxID=1872444 RepID=UPI004056C897
MAKLSRGYRGHLDATAPIRITEEELRNLLLGISHNIQYNSTNSGSIVNYLGAPADTTGETVRSMRVDTETNGDWAIISLSGRKGIWNIDKGNPPAKSTGEYPSFRSFHEAIKTWARAKEFRYGLQHGEIPAYAVAKSVWRKGGVLFQEGGGTQSVRDLIPPVIESIERRIDEVAEDVANGIIYQIANDENS